MRGSRVPFYKGGPARSSETCQARHRRSVNVRASKDPSRFVIPLTYDPPPPTSALTIIQLEANDIGIAVNHVFLEENKPCFSFTYF